MGSAPHDDGCCDAGAVADAPVTAAAGDSAAGWGNRVRAPEPSLAGSMLTRCTAMLGSDVDLSHRAPTVVLLLPPPPLQPAINREKNKTKTYFEVGYKQGSGTLR